jgi:hypothetical protein
MSFFGKKYGILTVLPSTAHKLLRKMTDHPNHKFIPDTVDFAEASSFPPALIQGHKQITDLYLLLLAKKNRCPYSYLRRKICKLG